MTLSETLIYTIHPQRRLDSTVPHPPHKLHRVLTRYLARSALNPHTGLTGGFTEHGWRLAVPRDRDTSGSSENLSSLPHLPTRGGQPSPHSHRYGPMLGPKCPLPSIPRTKAQPGSHASCGWGNPCCLQKPTLTLKRKRHKPGGGVAGPLPVGAGAK